MKSYGFLPIPKASLVDRVFRATLVLATGVALLVPAAARRGDLPARAARRPRLRARNERCEGRARRHGRDERRRDGPDPRVRHARRVLGRHADVPVTRSRRHADRASARAAARRCGHRLARRFRAAGPARRHVRCARRSTSRSRRSPSFSRSRSSRARSTSARPVRRSRSIDPTLPAAARTLGAGPGAGVLPRRAAAGGRRARGRRSTGVRPRDRRVRRHDHVRRLARRASHRR